MMKEKLIELIEYGQRCFMEDDDYEKISEFLADYLLEKGVIVLPCKVGDTVWFIRTGYKDELLQTTVEKIVLKSRGLHLKLACNAMYETSCNSIGKTVFLTREEAEKALAERRG